MREEFRVVASRFRLAVKSFPTEGLPHMGCRPEGVGALIASAPQFSFPVSLSRSAVDVSAKIAYASTNPRPSPGVSAVSAHTNLLYAAGATTLFHKETYQWLENPCC